MNKKKRIKMKLSSSTSKSIPSHFSHFMFITLLHCFFTTKTILLHTQAFVLNHPKCTTSSLVKLNRHDQHDQGTRPTIFPHNSACTSLSPPPPRTRVSMNWFSDTFQQSTGTSSGSSTKSSSSSSSQHSKITILQNIGSGSYGTVHYCTLDNNVYVAKRAWTKQELQDRIITPTSSSSSSSPSSSNSDDRKNEDDKKKTEQLLTNKVKRCNYYLNVEQHCFEKIIQSNKNHNSYGNLPQYIGRFQDSENGYEWLVFELIASSSKTTTADAINNENENSRKAARSLNHVMYLDWKDQHNNNRSSNNNNDDENQAAHHHLYMIQKELGLDATTFDNTLDIIMKSLLQILIEIHQHNLVHRDIKPDNILIDGHDHKLVLIDFGSAADMDPIKNSFGVGSKFIGVDDVVAVSPIYAAPETFVKPGK